MAFYRRNLPHWHPPGRGLFITWRLHFSIEKLHYLARPEIAEIVIRTLHYHEKELHSYELITWVVMSNHVHMLVNPLTDPRVFMKSLKNFSARNANLCLDRMGKAFWQREYFDHWMRTGSEALETIDYIELNPVHAGIVRNREEYLWSSARQGSSGLQTGAPLSGPAASDLRSGERSYRRAELPTDAYSPLPMRIP